MDIDTRKPRFALLLVRVIANRLAPMKAMVILASAVVFSASSGTASSATQCLAEGEPIQWIADYCMLKMETDDEIAVSGCIEEERKKSFTASCASNLHFKTKMCEVVIRNGTRAGSVDQCVKDPKFKGRVVEAGGV
jgi:hypothetical protein